MAAGHYADSPFLEFLETRLEEWRDGWVRIGLVLKPFHLNRSGVVHGGVMATLLDHAGGFCGLYSDIPGQKRRGMTLSLTANYLKQSRTGKLIAFGERVSGGRKIFYARSEVQAEDGAVLANGTGVYRYRSGSEPV
jgi:uncharacterized protein (TIGR00369 family)